MARLTAEQAQRAYALFADNLWTWLHDQTISWGVRPRAFCVLVLDKEGVKPLEERILLKNTFGIRPNESSLKELEEETLRTARAIFHHLPTEQIKIPEGYWGNKGYANFHVLVVGPPSRAANLITSVVADSCLYIYLTDQENRQEEDTTEDLNPPVAS